MGSFSLPLYHPSFKPILIVYIMHNPFVVYSYFLNILLTISLPHCEASLLCLSLRSCHSLWSLHLPCFWLLSTDTFVILKCNHSKCYQDDAPSSITAPPKVILCLLRTALTHWAKFLFPFHQLIPYYTGMFSRPSHTTLSAVYLASWNTSCPPLWVF